jgi:hypothetical protein
LRVIDPDIAKQRVAPDRAFDPADPDAEARRGGQRGDPVDEQAVAGGGVQEGRQRSDQQHDGEQQAERTLDDPARPAAGTRGDRRILHQKA